MDNKLYKLMNWPEIEGIVYSECDNPYEFLGQHITPAGILIQAFYPNASSVTVKVDGQAKSYPMELADEAGYYAVLIPGKKKIKYTLYVTYDNDTSIEVRDPYAYINVLDYDMIKHFNAGICYDVYKLLGAHPTIIDDIPGVCFAIWAPNAQRVSVVGNFNNWDGRLHQMQKEFSSGIFHLFIPELSEGEIYKYEIKFKGGMIAMKSDPYGFACELRPDTASKVANIEKFEWSDSAWIANRDTTDYLTVPTSIYELHLGSFKKPDDDREFYNYRELAPLVIEYVKAMNYTHIELMPITEHPLDESWGYQVGGYYAPTSRFGSPSDFAFFINQLHLANIGVILDWVPAHFPKDDFGLSYFDGTPLYEHPNPAMANHPDWGTLTFNYKSPQVKNFLIANALFWAKEYHVDGIRSDAVASMLYLDYGRNYGEWEPNIYGGKENLDSIEFIKHLNSIFKKQGLSTMLIAEESTAWPRVTGNVDEDSLGYDYKWNMGWMNDFLHFMSFDPIYRKAHYGELTFSMIYNYSENFILPLSHDEVVHGKASMIYKMPGDTIEEKLANLRVAYGYMFMHPGKKLLFMGQDFAMTNEWYEKAQIDWELLEYPEHKAINEYVKELNRLYTTEPALYDQDFNPEGFRWINCISADETLLVFERISKAAEKLLIVANFTPVVRANYKIGVPDMGKYKEIFNSDNTVYGGQGNVNPRLKVAKEDECDGLDYSIRIKVPPMGISVFRYVPVATKEVAGNAKAKANIREEQKNRKPRSVAKTATKSAKSKNTKGDTK